MNYLLSDILRKECTIIDYGQDNSCNNHAKRYVQKVVLINKSDISKYKIEEQSELFQERHRIKFSLKKEKKGISFIGQESGNLVYGSFSKTTVDGQPQYAHNIQMSVLGALESSKLILKKLDIANYFAALQLMDGTVEIYGFEFGLTTSDYDYDIQNNDGGSIIVLSSNNNLLENEVPYKYKSSTGNEVEDFENDFSNYRTGDEFSEDFNNDFNI